MNKAVVSKSVNTLIARELIVPADGPRGSRPLYLTRGGRRHARPMKPISLQGQEIVLSGLSAAEVAQLNALLIRLLQKTPELSSAADSTPTTSDCSAALAEERPRRARVDAVDRSDHRQFTYRHSLCT